MWSLSIQVLDSRGVIECHCRRCYRRCSGCYQATTRKSREVRKIQHAPARIAADRDCRPVPSNSTGSLAASQLETIRQRYNVPGLAAGHIAANNLSSTAVGVRKQGNSQLLKSGDVFHLGACTATITAMLAAKFVDEGHLSWNTTLPEIYGSAAVHAMHQNTTIGMLSSSTAGIYSTESAAAFEAWWDDFRDESADPVMLRASFTSEVLARPPNTVPGTVYNFSTPGYMALASILERKTNRTWEDLTSELFSSMQMDGCGFGVQPESSRSAVENPWPHTASSSGPVPQIPDGLHGDNPSALWPALGVHCTLPSFARYLQIHLDGYHGRPTPILSRRSFDVLQSTWPVVLGHSPTYGGWSYDAVSANGTELYISGTNTMNYAWGWLLLEQDEAFLSFTNVGSEVGRSASAAALYSLAGYSDPPHGV